VPLPSPHGEGLGMRHLSNYVIGRIIVFFMIKNLSFSATIAVEVFPRHIIFNSLHQKKSRFVARIFNNNISI
jgi:hypothetical protein